MRTALTTTKPVHLLWPAAALALLLLPACRGTQTHGKPSRWLVKRSPQQEMLRALEATDADVRREAAANVAESDQVDRDWAVDGLGAMARTDPDTQVRCTAIAGLQRSGRAEAVDTLLQILHADQHPDGIAPPDSSVRRAAVDGLRRLCAAGVADASQRAACCETITSLLTNDADRHVRLAAAQALRAFSDRQALPVLVGSLRDRDFGVAFAARESLVALTGMGFGYDVSAWQDWLAQTSEPFANAPSKPAESRPWWKLW